MRTISQVAELTGISTRTLQYYDEIGLLKSSELTQSGYRLYNDEAEVDKLAIKQFGSVEKYTEAMKYNLEHFSEIMETQLSEEAKEIAKRSDMLYGKLTADLSEDVSSPKIQSIVQEIWQFIQKNSTNVSISCSKSYMDMLINAYSNDYIKTITDNKYKKGASDYIAKSFHYY